MSFKYFLPVCFLAILSVANAQQTTATLLGSVSDASGAAVAGVAIQAANLATNVQREAVTDASGSYTLPNLPPGTYRVTATKTGFQVARAENVTLQVEQAARLDLPMTAALCVIAFLGLGVSLPSSPGFIGVFQAATVLALSMFGIDKADALSYSLLLHASQFIPITLWGLLLLVVEQVSLTDVARARSAPAASSGD